MYLKNSKKIVIKIGSSLLVDKNNKVRKKWLSSFAKDIQKLIQELPDDQKEVLKYRFYNDMSFKEISDKTGVSINTSLGRMRYALINLRNIIDKKNIVLTS